MNSVSEHALAVLVDIENMARPGARNRGEFDIHLVLNRLAEKGRVVVKRAYADWSRYRDARRELMNAGLELIEMPSAREGAKNRADIKMAVDAMEIAYSRQHVDNFVIVSGDSDFTPLVGKLRELNKRVIGVGRDVSSASPLLIANCDEFFFYDSLASKAVPNLGGGGVRPDALSLLRETLMARGREGDELPQASAVKDSMRRRDPAFDEGEIGFATFSKFLEDAQSKGVVRLNKDPRSGTFTVELVDAPSASDWPTLGETRPAGDERPVEIGEGRRRRRRRRGEPSTERPASDEDVAEDGAEVFVIELREKEFTAEMPPLDQPITYEDIVLSADEIGAESPELEEEVSDVAEDAPPTRGSRRRRRSLATVAEPTTEDLGAESGAVADEEAAAEPEAEAAPTSRRRVRRGSVLGTLATEDAETAAEAPAEEEEAPKPRRRTRAKAVEEETAEPTPEDEEKPKRKTRAKKATDETVEAGSAAEEEKPKRRTRAKKETDETAEMNTATEEDKPKRRTRTRKAVTDSEAADASSGISPKVSPY